MAKPDLGSLNKASENFGKAKGAGSGGGNPSGQSTPKAGSNGGSKAAKGSGTNVGAGKSAGNHGANGVGSPNNNHVANGNVNDDLGNLGQNFGQGGRTGGLNDGGSGGVGNMANLGLGAGKSAANDLDNSLGGNGSGDGTGNNADGAGANTGGGNPMSPIAGAGQNGNGDNSDAADPTDNVKNALGNLGSGLKNAGGKLGGMYAKFNNAATDKVMAFSKAHKLGLKKKGAAVMVRMMLASGLGAGAFGAYYLTQNHKTPYSDAVCSVLNSGSESYAGVTDGAGGGEWTQEGTDTYKTAKAVVDHLKGLGFSGNAIAGIMGNMAQECGFNLGDENKTEASGGSSSVASNQAGFGLIQWTGGRRTALQALAKTMGGKESDLKVQLAQLDLDLKNKSYWVSGAYSGWSLSNLNSQGSPSAAAMYFYLSQYEAGGGHTKDPDGSGTKRQAYAETAYTTFGLSSVKGDSSKVSALIGGASSTTANGNASSAESANSAICNGNSASGDTSSVLSTAKSLLGYFTYSQETRTKITSGSNYQDISSLSDIDRNGTTDCSGFVWTVLKLAGYKVPDQMWATTAMQADANGDQTYLKKVSDSNAKAGDVIVVNLGSGDGSNGHTAILEEDYHGDDTKIIQEGGGSDQGVNESTIGNSFYPTLRGGTVTFAEPIKK